MTEEQKRLLLLLAEFNELCTLGGCAYSLVEHQLVFALRSLGIRGCEVDVAMLYDDFLKFKSLFEEAGMENRAIESIENNPRMPGWYFRYVDTSTTLFMLDYHIARRYHCIGINIHIIRSKGADASNRIFTRSLLSAFETGLASGVLPDYANKSRASKHTKLQSCFVSINRVLFGSGRFSRHLSDAFPLVAAKNDESETKLVMPRGGTFVLPAGFLSTTEDATLSGAPVKISALYQDYLIGRYGRGWRNKIPYYEKEGYKVLTSTTVPYCEFLESAGSIVHDPRFWKRWSQFQSNYYSKVLPAQEKQTAWWNEFYFLKDRYSDWKKIVPYKDEIRTLFKYEEYDLLWLFFENYRKHIQKHKGNGLPLVIDEGIWSIVISLYRLNGHERDADELKALHDKKPLPPIDGEAAEAFLQKPVQDNRENGELIREIVQGQNEFYFLKDRYSDWKKIVPYKDEIRTLFKNEEYDLLWLFFESYRKHIQKHKGNGLPLVIDEGIWNIVVSLYRLNGHEHDADELTALHDEKPLPPIDGETAEAFLGTQSEDKWVVSELLCEILRGVSG